jgi:hypothetical protein
MAFQPKQKSEAKPRPGVMYVNKRDRRPTIFNLRLNAEHLPAPDEKGIISLIGFVNDYKKDGDNSPDVKFSVPKEQPAADKKTFKPRQKDSAASDSDAGGDDWF